MKKQLDSEQLFAGLFSLPSRNSMKTLFHFAALMHQCQSRFYLAKMPRILQKTLFSGLAGLGRLWGQQPQIINNE